MNRLLLLVFLLLPDSAWSQAAYQNRSGTIAAGNSAQQLMPANPNRRGGYVQNVSAADLWINDIGGTAVVNQPSYKLVAGATYTCVPGFAPLQSMSIIGGTTAQAFTAREW